MSFLNLKRKEKEKGSILLLPLTIQFTKWTSSYIDPLKGVDIKIRNGCIVYNPPN